MHKYKSKYITFLMLKLIICKRLKLIIKLKLLFVSDSQSILGILKSSTNNSV